MPTVATEDTEAKMLQLTENVVVFIAMMLLEVEGDSTYPNIIFTIADDLGYGDVGYNGGKASTPNLDAMAAAPHTLHLTRYYSGAPVCSPTRGTVLTGKLR